MYSINIDSIDSIRQILADEGFGPHDDIEFTIDQVVGKLRSYRLANLKMRTAIEVWKNSCECEACEGLVFPDDDWVAGKLPCLKASLDT